MDRAEERSVYFAYWSLEALLNKQVHHCILNALKNEKSKTSG